MTPDARLDRDARDAATELHPKAVWGGRRYGALRHRGRDGWYVLDHHTNRVAVIDDHPQTGLSARVAGALAAMLNAAAHAPHRRH